MSYNNKIGWRFDNTYSKLLGSMLARLAPTPVKAPELVVLNHSLSKMLELDFSSTSDKNLASIFSGNLLPEGSDTIAQAYAGHQFGYFTMLGDGRAALSPMLREYIVSETMHSLGIPTTRSLSVVKTGENVIRETPLKKGTTSAISANTSSTSYNF